jgi:hypothetical protein
MVMSLKKLRKIIEKDLKKESWPTFTDEELRDIINTAMKDLWRRW